MSASNTLTTAKSSTPFDPAKAGREITHTYVEYVAAHKAIADRTQQRDAIKAKLIDLLRAAHGHVADFKAFLKEHVNIPRSTAYRMLAIADGRGETIRQQERDSKRRARVQVLDTSEPTAPKPFATLKREVDAQWRAQLPENQPCPEPTPAKIAERVADAELAAFEFSYSTKDHYNKVSKQAAEIGVTLPPMKEGRGKRTIRLYLPVAMAEVIEEKLGNVNRVPVWAAKARDARKRHGPGGALKFINDAASTLQALEDWQYMLSNHGELDGDAIDDNIVAGAKAAAEAWAKLYETILRQLRTNVIPLKKERA